MDTLGNTISTGDDDYDYVDPERQSALFGAILFHGMSCFATGAIPPGKEKVLETAKAFETYLQTGEIPVKVINKTK